MARAALLLALPALAACAGCTGAIFSIESYRTQYAYTDQALAEFERARAAGPVDKSDVLATLGPPIHVIGQDDGEIFVYRRFARDRNTINLNPATVSFFGPMPPIPVYFGSDVSGRDDTMMVFFGPDGGMRGVGTQLGVEETARSRAARIGQGVRGIID